MDLSVNKVKNVKQNQIGFSGMKGAYNANNSPVYKFILPPYNKDKEQVVLEIINLTKDKNGMFIPPQKSKLKKYKPNEGKDYIEIDQKRLKRFGDGFAYRFRIDSKDNDVNKTRYFIDAYKTIKLADSDEELNVIDQGINYAITPKIGPMRHSFLDSDAILDKNGLKPLDKTFVRNHFNKLGGSTKGLTYLLKNTDVLDPYTYIMSTPDIGVDKISSHRYWPSNQYQCGNMDDLKEFNFELFKRGKGYIADGAFTSQSIQSPMVQHVLKWGETSPFYNMLKINGKLQLGILPNKTSPDDDSAWENIGVRIINRKGGENYDYRKPTFIQFFDKRLLSAEKQNDGKYIHTDYDTAPEDHYDIVTHNDSIQPFYFEVDPNDEKILRTFRYRNALPLNEIDDLRGFLNFENFTLTSKDNAGGANYWDGNVDIIKMNLSNPEKSPEGIKGYKAARNYLLGVASFWSEAIQSDLILKTAQLSEAQKKEIAKNNRITDEEYAQIKKNLDSANSLVLSQNKTVYDYIKEFPLQSIETSPELSAVFSEPEFKEEFLDTHILTKLSNIIDNVIDCAIPEEYKKNNEYRSYVIKTYANQIIRNIYIGAIRPKALSEKDGSVNLNKLKDTYVRHLTSFNFDPVSVKDEKNMVISHLQKNLRESSANGIMAQMKEDLKNISLEDFKLAESIVLNGRGGLNWRFDASKDIADLDAVRSGNATFEKVWEDAQSFWADYIQNVRKYNPSSYIVAEVTDFWGFLGNWGKEDFIKFDSKLAQDYFDHAQEYGDTNERKLPYTKEMQFFEQTNATTGSNYNSYFNSLSMLIGVNPETLDNWAIDTTKYRVGNIEELKKISENFMKYAQPNVAMLSHIFFENHDKPRLLHTLPLNMEIFLMKDLSKADEKTKEFAEKITGRKDYADISPRAIAVAQIMAKEIEKYSKIHPEYKDDLYAALRSLVNGCKENSNVCDIKRATAFGNMPYEVSTRDLFQRAGIENEKDIELFCYDMLKNSMQLQERLWQIMCVIGGVNALFNGMEYAQTGYEEPSKNPDVTNRNQILHHRSQEKGFDEYYKKVSATSALYQQKELSALKDGFKVSLPVYKFGEKEDEISLWPIYSYDEKGSKTISLITNNGLPKSLAYQNGAISPKAKEVASIPIKDENGISPLEDGTKLRRKIYDKDCARYVDDNIVYYVENGEIKSKAGAIVLSDTVENFYVPKGSQKIKITPKKDEGEIPQNNQSYINRLF